MPVSTRSQFIYSSNRQPNSNPNQNQKINPRIDEKDEQCRNPHYGLKENETKSYAKEPSSVESLFYRNGNGGKVINLMTLE
ncbi:hypothetical protein Leryth_006137 [Lithospermum erythrorhizon]|nr:hypothetical protein Leryth_006137 [Lithospermum erythrorhizon]